MDHRSVVRVRIAGEEFTVRTEASPEHTRAVAEHVDRTIRTILASGPAMEPHKAAILAALQITDALFQEQGAAEAITAGLRQLAGEIRPLLPPPLRGEEGAAG